MGTSKLDNVFPFLCFIIETISKLLEGRNEILFDLYRSCNIHRCGKRVVRRLRHVYIVIWMNWNFTSQRFFGELGGAVGYDFVHVHVELRAASCHPNMQGKLIVMFSIKDFIANVE